MVKERNRYCDVEKWLLAMANLLERQAQLNVEPERLNH